MATGAVLVTPQGLGFSRLNVTKQNVEDRKGLLTRLHFMVIFVRAADILSWVGGRMSMRERYCRVGENDTSY